jgi:hypothetical protein
MTDDDFVMARVDDQIQWYDRKSSACQRSFKRLKTLTIVVATLIPLVSGSTNSRVAGLIAGALGATVAIIEGIQHLNQYQSTWITYRSTAEALKHEKFLYMALAGPYADSANPRALLAERTESILSQEHTKWTATREPTQQGAQPQGNARNQ